MRSSIRDELIVVHELTGVEIICDTCKHLRIYKKHHRIISVLVRGCGIYDRDCLNEEIHGYPDDDYICESWEMAEDPTIDPFDKGRLRLYSSPNTRNVR